MGDIALCLTLISVALTSRALSSSSSSSSSAINFRGISPQDENYYKTGIIWCRDGSKSFSSKYLNDDFCDCGDGTDEPGTSACANGRFYCQNKGHTPLWIFSSRVNDGICDCCDGSDEYDGKATCVNTCSESGKVWRDKLRKKISTFKAGLEVRNRDIERTKLMIQKDRLEVANLKLEEKKLKDVVKKLGAMKEAIEEAEEKEKLAREEEQNARKEEEEETDRQKDEKKNTEQEKIEAEGELDLETKIEPKGEQKVTINNGIDSSEQRNMEGLSKEELGRLVASRWTGENPNLMKEESHGQVDDHHVEESIDGKEKFHDENENDDNMENEEEEEDSQGEGVVHADEKQANSLSEVEGSRAEPSMWTKLKNILKSFSGFYSLPSLPLDKSEADQIRKEYQQSNTKLSDIRSKISDLEKKLKQDFGKDGEFYSLYDKCFDFEENKYTYKVCPYRHALQMEGHSSTTLGNWDGFEDDYRSMHFTRGAKCWNGPDRSLKVRLRCGLKVELRDVDEPSRCEYVAELLTPAVCLKERLVALQQRLDTQGGVFPHDEL